MPHRSITANIEPIISRNVFARAVGDALRKFVGRNRDYSVKQLSNRSQVPDRRIECAMCEPESEDFRPLAPECLASITLVLGPRFTSEWLSLAGQGAFTLPDADDTPPGALAIENAEDNAKLTRAAMDGKFTDDEKPELKVVASHLIERGMKLRSMAA